MSGQQQPVSPELQQMRLQQRRQQHPQETSLPPSRSLPEDTSGTTQGSRPARESQDPFKSSVTAQGPEAVKKVVEATTIEQQDLRRELAETIAALEREAVQAMEDNADDPEVVHQIHDAKQWAANHAKLEADRRFEQLESAKRTAEDRQQPVPSHLAPVDTPDRSVFEKPQVPAKSPQPGDAASSGSQGQEAEEAGRAAAQEQSSTSKPADKTEAAVADSPGSPNLPSKPAAGGGGGDDVKAVASDYGRSLRGAIDRAKHDASEYVGGLVGASDDAEEASKPAELGRTVRQTLSRTKEEIQELAAQSREAVGGFLEGFLESGPADQQPAPPPEQASAGWTASAEADGKAPLEPLRPVSAAEAGRSAHGGTTVSTHSTTGTGGTPVVNPSTATTTAGSEKRGSGLLTGAATLLKSKLFGPPKP